MKSPTIVRVLVSEPGNPLLSTITRAEVMANPQHCNATLILDGPWGHSCAWCGATDCGATATAGCRICARTRGDAQAELVAFNARHGLTQ